MGLVNYLNRTSDDDDYSREVIGLAKDRSEKIRDWLAEEGYLLETDQENVTYEWLRNRCVVMIGEDLFEMGIRVGIDIDTVCDQPQLVYAFLMLRKKFDEENLTELLKTHRTIRELWSEIAVDTDCLVDFVKRCSDILPLDEGWLLLANTFDEYPGVWENTHLLSDTINEICDRCDQSAPAVDEDVDPDKVIKFVSLLHKRAEIIRDLAKQLLYPVATDKYDKAAVASMIDAYIDKGFEIQLGLRECMSKHAEEIEHLDYSNDTEVKMFLSKIRKPYLKFWEHALEYFTVPGNNTVRDVAVAVMTATLVADSDGAYMSSANAKLTLGEYQDRIDNAVFSVISESMTALLSNKINEDNLSYAT